jgi:hypothetical protein
MILLIICSASAGTRFFVARFLFGPFPSALSQPFDLLAARLQRYHRSPVIQVVEYGTWQFTYGPEPVYLLL